MLGSNRRLRTIYRANMRSARAAGQWARIERTKRLRPYLLYQLGPSERHRPHHESKQGWVLPADHSFWDWWFPPNGWGCKCWVRQIGKAEAERRGVSPDPAMQMRKVHNPATGELREVPFGLDAAWAGNPGKTRLANVEKLLGDKLQGLPPEAQAVAARDLAGSWRARRIHDGDAPGSVPVAVIPEAAAELVEAETRVVRYGGTIPEKMRQKRAWVGVELLSALHAALEGAVGDTVFPEGRSIVAFGLIDGRLWRFVIKRPLARRDELWVSTWHHSRPGKLDGARRRWRDRHEDK